MTLTWVICGAGRGVGKTQLAQRLCRILPGAAYAKQGCGPRKPDKPANLFRSDAELASFMEACAGRHDHLVVESNALARAGRGDIVIFVDGFPGRTDVRPDIDVLRSRAHLIVGANARREDWSRVLCSKVTPPAVCDAVCDALADHQGRQRGTTPGLARVEPLRIDTAGSAAPARDPGDVAIEELITVQVEEVGSFAILCTPRDIEALAVGFAFSEGLIGSRDDVVDLRYRPVERVAALRLDHPGPAAPNRNLIVSSACGLCGHRNVERLLAEAGGVGDALRVSAPVLRSVVEQMAARQTLFQRTGGTHAAAVFSADGEIIALAEDIGRHNALDKAVGQCLLKGLPVRGRGVALSGRVSLELVAKAARAGLELLAAVSAPSSLAIRVADNARITLCGFVRGHRATVYTHPHRIVGRPA